MRRHFLQDQHVHSVHPTLTSTFLQKGAEEGVSIPIIIGPSSLGHPRKCLNQHVFPELVMDLGDRLLGLLDRSRREQASLILHPMTGTSEIQTAQRRKGESQ